jgi:hypothetical protein
MLSNFHAWDIYNASAAAAAAAEWPVKMAAPPYSLSEAMIGETSKLTCK